MYNSILKPDKNTLLGGDLNLYIDPKLDKLENMSHKWDNPIYRKEIVSLNGRFNLSDCLRDLNPTRRYTWHSKGKSSRLDIY